MSEKSIKIEEVKQADEINIEREKEPTTKVVIELMRHVKKDKELSKVFNKIKDSVDEAIRITPEGKEQARKRGVELGTIAVAVGGKKIRTRETAAYLMLANEDINPHASLEDMEKYISEHQKVGKKIITDERLSLTFEGTLRDQVTAAHKKGEVLNFYLNDSDREAIKYGDKKSTSYSRISGNIAEIIKSYSLIGNNFNKIASKTDKYKKYGNQLERYLGTQMSIPACFLVKVFEKIGDQKKKEEFLEALCPVGFKEAQGIRFEIVNQGAEQKIVISYEAGNLSDQVEIVPEIIDDIIKDREEFEKNFDVKSNYQNCYQSFKRRGQG
ncbi:MAG: hypothetical protein U9R14_02515 [Patescibacteria group bacterium]|nr:hypothetical protein [Patescibacteria group bacterium]